jgi:hypothetical protein
MHTAAVGLEAALPGLLSPVAISEPVASGDRLAGGFCDSTAFRAE